MKKRCFGARESCITALISQDKFKLTWAFTHRMVQVLIVLSWFPPICLPSLSHFYNLRHPTLPNGLTLRFLYSFRGSTITVYHKLGDFNSRKLLSGGLKSESKEWPGGCEGESACLSPSFWWFAGILGILCLVEASFHSLPLSSHSILPVWVSASKFLLFIKTSVILDLEPTLLWSGLPGSSDDKEFTCSERDLGLIHGLGRSPKERNGSPLQYSCLANPVDRGTW